MTLIHFGCLASKRIFLGQKTDDELRSIYARCRDVIKQHKCGGNLPADYDKKTLAAASKYLSQDLQSFGAKKMGSLNRLSVACTARILGFALDAVADYRVVYTSPETEMWDPMASTMSSHTDKEAWIETMAYCLGCSPEWVTSTGWVD
jgi:hypothetical protein